MDYSSTLETSNIITASKAREATTPPNLLYGTAWKSQDTLNLVGDAIDAEIRAFNTAAQPRHYREDLLGTAIKSAIAANTITRHDIYLQTKFTSVAGQDKDNMPCNRSPSLRDQVASSIASSLNNLNHIEGVNESRNEDYLDCLVLHAPLSTLEATLEVWEELSLFVLHPVRCLGISNIKIPLLQELYGKMRLKPTIIQNAFHFGTGYDREVTLAFCREREECRIEGFGYSRKILCY